LYSRDRFNRESKLKRYGIGGINREIASAITGCTDNGVHVSMPITSRFRGRIVRRFGLYIPDNTADEGGRDNRS